MTSSGRRQQPGSSKPSREALRLLAIGIPILLVAGIAAVALRPGADPARPSPSFAGLASPATSGDPSQTAGAASVKPTAPSDPAASGSPAASDGSSVLERPDSPTRGPADAPVTLVEFLDPECEACRAAYPWVEALLEEYQGQIRLVVRYFPLHGNSALAAVATEAAGQQGRYWEMQELLFARQPEWGESQQPELEAFVRYAGELGLDVERFDSDIRDPRLLAKVERDLQDARAVGAAGTPTFFVNGQLVEEFSESALRSAVEDALDP